MSLPHDRPPRPPGLTRASRWAGLVIAAAVVVSPSLGHAQRRTAAASKVAVASAYVDAGLRAENDGHYDAAIDLYGKAYALVPHPVLLFDIAQAHRRAGRPAEALALYRRYVDDDPDGPRVRAARERISELESRAQDASSAPAAERVEDDAPGAAPAADPEPDRAETTPHASAVRVATAEREPPTAVDLADRERPVPNRRTDEAQPPAWLRLGLGTSLAQRQLAFHSTVAGPPNDHFTAGSVRLQGEIYPLALLASGSVTAGLGLAVAYDQPILRSDVSVEYAYHALGVRYRLGLGAASTLAIGADLVRRQYLGFLPPRGALAVPNIDYSLIAPTIAGRMPVTRSAALFARLDALIASNGEAGEVTRENSYGRGDLFGFAAAGGVEIALGRRLGLRFAFEYSQMNFVFDGFGDLASNTDGDRTTQEVQGATDRSLGVVITLDVTD